MQMTIRKATAADAAALADLRLGVLTEEGDRYGPDRDVFVEFFSTWISDHQLTHLPFLAEVDGNAVGMAWLMVADRVPDASQRYRGCGDVQTVYVVPDLRDHGIGAALIEAVLVEASGRQLEHVTVHANDRALPFYQRAGFQHDPCWLRWAPVTAIA
jgi:GNAT superfamily N-acetyltransferase